MYVIVVYVPARYAANIAQVLADAGAGEVGCYRACSFQVLGQGQFEAIAGAQPFMGKVGELETVEEVRLEMVCVKGRVRSALKAMIAAHPYEQPAYHVIEAKTLADFPD